MPFYEHQLVDFALLHEFLLKLSLVRTHTLRERDRPIHSVV